jgi:hypothetical protein
MSWSQWKRVIGFFPQAWVVEENTLRSAKTPTTAFSFGAPR